MVTNGFDKSTAQPSTQPSTSPPPNRPRVTRDLIESWRAFEKFSSDVGGSAGAFDDRTELISAIQKPGRLAAGRKKIPPKKRESGLDHEEPGPPAKRRKGNQSIVSPLLQGGSQSVSPFQGSTTAGLSPVRSGQHRGTTAAAAGAPSTPPFSLDVHGKPAAPVDHVLHHGTSAATTHSRTTQPDHDHSRDSFPNSLLHRPNSLLEAEAPPFETADHTVVASLLLITQNQETPAEWALVQAAFRAGLISPSEKVLYEEALRGRGGERGKERIVELNGKICKGMEVVARRREG